MSAVLVSNMFWFWVFQFLFPLPYYKSASNTNNLISRLRTVFNILFIYLFFQLIQILKLQGSIIQGGKCKTEKSVVPVPSSKNWIWFQFWVLAFLLQFSWFWFQTCFGSGIFWFWILQSRTKNRYEILITFRPVNVKTGTSMVLVPVSRSRIMIQILCSEYQF